MGQHARRRHTPEQFIRKLREADRLLGPRNPAVTLSATRPAVSSQAFALTAVGATGQPTGDQKACRAARTNHARRSLKPSDVQASHRALARGCF